MLDQGLLIRNSTLIIPNFIGFVVHGLSLVAFAAIVTPKVNCKLHLFIGHMCISACIHINTKATHKPYEHVYNE